MRQLDTTLHAQQVRTPLDYAMSARDRDTPAMVAQALRAGACALALQPVVTAPGREVAFHEGLIRLTDPGGRVLPAAAFMGAVEETATGRDLDAASLGLALGLLRARPGMRLSVNVSARSLGDSAFRAVLAELVADDGTLGERLILEICERSAMLLPEIVARFMEELQPQGVAFALDDFGGGFLSFRHLRRFFFDLVKIDRGFISGIDGDADNQVLVRALLGVAHQFDAFVVAPGVERAEEAAWLEAAGVDCLQGYFFGAPKVTR
ncbi:EAL domain protein [Oceanicola granulosus HTCC2516]|uniref:EAL domain protein n=1 Tax=Oceanicola granulosus (strain ATCC BAA-861 / DSM 15982 / KCTC 12143 / HTCC2516) TaxID=314256 RepID=Q2CCH1_OCEGH|nr:EAL domain-containing protein [Oceanicola granulosus]EAR50347.1 EAL domain protein [Oceanicola granulosus HTCC2516]